MVWSIYHPPAIIITWVIDYIVNLPNMDMSEVLLINIFYHFQKQFTVGELFK